MQRVQLHGTHPVSWCCHSPPACPLARLPAHLQTPPAPAQHTHKRRHPACVCLLSDLLHPQVHQSVAKVLGGVEVAASTPLMTAGLDSLGAVELRKELSRQVRRRRWLGGWALMGAAAAACAGAGCWWR